MGTISDIVERVTGVTTLNARVTDLYSQLSEMRHLVLAMQRDIAELKGQNKALILIQSGKRSKSE